MQALVHTARLFPQPTFVASHVARCVIQHCTHFAKINGVCLLHHRQCLQRTPRSASSPTQNRNKKCSVPDCLSLARRGGHCTRHGGGRKCKVETCTTNAQTGGYCRVHGGGSRCRQRDCNHFARFRGLCLQHSKSNTSM